LNYGDWKTFPMRLGGLLISPCCCDDYVEEGIIWPHRWVDEVEITEPARRDCRT